MTRLAIDATSDAQVAGPATAGCSNCPTTLSSSSATSTGCARCSANLLSNAGRHTPDGTTVTVRVSDALPDDGPGTAPSRSRTGRCRPRPGWWSR